MKTTLNKTIINRNTLFCVISVTAVFILIPDSLF